MGKAEEKLRIFENVMARVGLNGNFLEEYFKGLSTINGLQSFAEMNPPMPMQGQNVNTQPPVTQNEATVSPMGNNGLGGSIMP